MRLSPAEEVAAQLVHSDVTLALRQVLSTKRLTLLGSRSTGLAAPTSDFNYRIDIDSPKRSSTDNSPELTTDGAKSTRRRVLEGIWKYLEESKNIAATELVFAPVPIIKCRHRATGLRIRFEIMAPSQASQQYTAAYLSEFPSLRPLYILIRHFLEIRGLTAVSRGGLGSYTILMMIVAALKQFRAESAPNDLGRQLLHVLKFYGNANLYDFTFSVEPPCIFSKEKPMRSRAEGSSISSDPQLYRIVYPAKNSSGRGRKSYLLCLQDPANAYNDLGRPSYAIKHIQLIIQKMRTSIKKAVSRPKLTQKHEDWSFLAPMVRADYSLFEITRRHIEDCNTPDAGLNPEDADKDTISALLERRLKIYRGEMEEDKLLLYPEDPESPSNPADTDTSSNPPDTDLPTKSEDTDIHSKTPVTDSPSNPSDTDSPSEPADTDRSSNPPDTDLPSKSVDTDLPSKPADIDSRPGIITKYNSTGWYPNEYIFKPHAKQNRSRRQIEQRTARMVAKRRAYRNKDGADAMKEKVPVAEKTSDSMGELTSSSNV